MIIKGRVYKTKTRVKHKLASGVKVYEYDSYYITPLKKRGVDLQLPDEVYILTSLRPLLILLRIFDEASEIPAFQKIVEKLNVEEREVLIKFIEGVMKNAGE